MTYGEAFRTGGEYPPGRTVWRSSWPQGHFVTLCVRGLVSSFVKEPDGTRYVPTPDDLAATDWEAAP